MRQLTTLAETRKLSLVQRQKAFITEQACAQLPIKENGEPLVDLAKYCRTHQLPIVIRSVWRREQVSTMKLRRSVAERLGLACRKLQQLFPDYTLKITDAHRPIRLQRQLFRQITASVARKNPQASAEELYLEVTKYIADPNNVPPHSTGGAVDVTIFNRRIRRGLDMGSRMNQMGYLSNTFSSSVAGQVKKNRKLLLKIMTDAGFVNVATEWWHYSYGDQYWAAVSGKKAAIFGSK